MGNLWSARFVVLFVILTGAGAAQDTNFPVGPQYLINHGSPLFLRPIETPSLSLSAPLAVNSSATAEEGTGEPGLPEVGGLKSQAAVDRIYWGAAPAGSSTAETAGAESSALPTEASAATRSSEIELSSTEPSSPIPSSITDVGVSAWSDARSKSSLSLGEVAAYWKVSPLRASRIFTNADVSRLHSN